MVIIIFLLIMGICTYLIILGGNQNKTEVEKMIDDQQQIEYLDKLKNGGKKKDECK